MRQRAECGQDSHDGDRSSVDSLRVPCYQPLRPLTVPRSILLAASVPVRHENRPDSKVGRLHYSLHLHPKCPIQVGASARSERFLYAPYLRTSAGRTIGCPLRTGQYATLPMRRYGYSSARTVSRQRHLDVSENWTVQLQVPHAPSTRSARTARLLLRVVPLRPVGPDDSSARFRLRSDRSAGRVAAAMRREVRSDPMLREGGRPGARLTPSTAACRTSRYGAPNPRTRSRRANLPVYRLEQGLDGRLRHRPWP